MSGAREHGWRSRERALNARIAHMVREQRLDLGVLQAQIATHLGLAESTFSRYESGQRILSAAMLCVIANYLRQPITTFVPPPYGGGTAMLPDTVEAPLQSIVQSLQQRPDLIPLVEGLLETLLADEHQPAS